MRRSAAVLAGIGCAMACLTSIAFAAPSVSFDAKPVPIAGFTHTGNITRSGAALQIRYTIGGSELHGRPWPLLAASIHLPQGVRVHPSGFATCSELTIERSGPSGCPRGSVAGPGGEALEGIDVGGQSTVETLTVMPFYAPGGGIEFFTQGSSPLAINVPWLAQFATPATAEGLDPTLTSAFTPVEATPGSPASIEYLKVRIGTALKHGARRTYFMTTPRSCPAGGFPTKSQLRFAEDGAVSKPVTVTVSGIWPCPLPKAEPIVLPPQAAQTPLRGAAGVVTAPANTSCIGGGSLTIHVLRPTRLRYRTLAIFISGKRVKLISGARRSGPVILSGLPAGRFTLRATVRTRSGRRLSGARTYSACAGATTPLTRLGAG